MFVNPKLHYLYTVNHFDRIFVQVTDLLKPLAVDDGHATSFTETFLRSHVDMHGVGDKIDHVDQRLKCSLDSDWFLH